MEFYNRLSQECPQLRTKLQASYLTETFEIAEVAAMSFDDLVSRLDRIWSDPRSDLVLKRLTNTDMTSSQQRAMFNAIRLLYHRSADLSPLYRHRSEKALYRLLHLLPLTLTRDFVCEYLRHKRAKIRQSAHRAYKSNGVDPSALHELLTQYMSRRKGSKNQEILHLIARCPEATERLDTSYLLSEIDSRYWRMRLLESMLCKNDEHFLKFSRLLPVQAVWAVARTSDPSHLPTVRDIFEHYSGDADVAAWCVWAFGRLGSRTDIDSCRRILRHFLSS